MDNDVLVKANIDAIKHALVLAYTDLRVLYLKGDAITLEEINKTSKNCQTFLQQARKYAMVAKTLKSGGKL